MSELKDYSILDIEAIDDERLEKSESGRIQETRVYIKSEADKVIAHHKYKRCLAMAKWCYAKWDDTATKYYKSVWYRKWEVKWLALAEKFKEAK